MNKKTFNKLAIIGSFIGFMFSVMANIYESHNLAEVSMYIYILFFLMQISSFIIYGKK